MSKCSGCTRRFNDSTQLPLATPCKHTNCLACIRQHTLASHPGLEASDESKVPTGRDIECLKCKKKVNTDNLVIDRAALASVPLSLEDLIIADVSPKKPSDSSSKSKKKTVKDPAADFDPGPGAVYPEDSSTLPGPDLSGGSKPSDQATHRGDLANQTQGPHFGWTKPTSPPDMDPNNPSQHPNQPGVVGWAMAPGQPHPQAPQQPGAYTQMPQPYGHAPQSHGSHHSHGPAIAAGAAGVAAGVGVGALATHAHKKKKDKKEKKHKEHKKDKKNKDHKKTKDKSRHRSSSESSNSSSSSGSSKSSKSSNSS